MNKPFEQAWELLKALPEDSLYTETIDSMSNQGGYQVAPSLLRVQERLKTMHPAIAGMLNRRRLGAQGIGKIVPEPTDTEGYEYDPKKFPLELYEDSLKNKYRIRDVPTATKQGHPIDEEGFPAPYTSQDDPRSPTTGNRAFRDRQVVDTPTSRHAQYDPYRTYDGKEYTGHQSPEVAMDDMRRHFRRAPPNQLLPRDQSMLNS